MTFGCGCGDGMVTESETENRVRHVETGGAAGKENSAKKILDDAGI